MINYYGLECFRPTKENWHPSYLIESKTYLQVRVLKLWMGDKPVPPKYRVCVWGADDMGMEFDTESETEAYSLYLVLCGQQYIELADLKARGFISA
jgi:hypothetical protein